MKRAPFAACLAVHDIGETLDFFESLGYRVGRDGVSQHGAVHPVSERDTVLFMVQSVTQANAFMPRMPASVSPASAMFYLYVDDIFAKLDQVGDKIDIIAKYEDDRCRVCYFPDPNGYVFAFVEMADDAR
ncbi:VOC family protein [Chromobacterium sp. CV08]|uniref:VOC family protein n=1 Tax=Chromobacterium sp. CV08 TaxID=3133274 RepID=UPI003DAA19F6